LSQCPFGHACMKQVTSAMVVERVQKILSTAKTGTESATVAYPSP
jgi:beta-lactamase class D